MRRGSGRSALVLPVLIVLFVGGGVSVLVVGFRERSRALETETWSTTNGTIRTSDIAQRLSDSTSSRPTRRRPVFKEEVTFDYEVEGRTYSGDRVTYSELWTSDRSEVEQVAARYPIGASVTVHYEPGHPENSVLETGLSFGTWIPIILGAAFVLAGALLFLFRRRFYYRS